MSLLTASTERDIQLRARVRAKLKAIKEATSINDHIGAKIMLAEVLDHKPALRVLKACREIHGAEYNTSQELSLIVHRWEGNMLRWIEIHHPQLLTEVRQCL